MSDCSEHTRNNNTKYFDLRPDLYSIKLPFQILNIDYKNDAIYQIKMRFIEFIKNFFVPCVEVNGLQNIDNDQHGYLKLLDYVSTDNLPLSFRLGETKTNIIMKNFCLLHDEESLDISKFKGYQFHFIISQETTTDPSHFMYIFPKIQINGLDEDYISYNLLKRDGTITLEDIENKVLSNLNGKMIGIDWKKMDLEIEHPIYIKNAHFNPIPFEISSLWRYKDDIEGYENVCDDCNISKSKKTKNDNFSKKKSKRIRLSNDSDITDGNFILSSILLSRTEADEF